MGQEGLFRAVFLQFKTKLSKIILLNLSGIGVDEAGFNTKCVVDLDQELVNQLESKFIVEKGLTSALSVVLDWWR